MMVPPYSFNKTPASGMSEPTADVDDVDRLVSDQINKGQPSYKVPETCPNPWHPRRPWHGFQEGSCPGSHVGVYEEPEYMEESPRVFDYFI